MSPAITGILRHSAYGPQLARTFRKIGEKGLTSVEDDAANADSNHQIGPSSRDLTREA